MAAAIELAAQLRDARRAANAADKAGQPLAAQSIRERAEELRVAVLRAVDVESAPRRQAEAERQAKLQSALMRALTELSEHLDMRWSYR